jgi:hypothetical protein
MVAGGLAVMIDSRQLPVVSRPVGSRQRATTAPGSGCKAQGVKVELRISDLEF